MILLDSKTFAGVSFVDLVNSSGNTYDEFRIALFNVSSNQALGSVLTVFCSIDGGMTFDTAPNYTDGGLSVFNPEGIAHVDDGANVNTGLHIGVDAADVPAHGTSGSVWISNAGVVNGVATHPSFRVHTSRAELGGNQLGLVAQGHYRGAPGARLNAFRIRSDVTGAPTSLVSGLVKLFGI